MPSLSPANGETGALRGPYSQDNAQPEIPLGRGPVPRSYRDLLTQRDRDRMLDELGLLQDKRLKEELFKARLRWEMEKIALIRSLTHQMHAFDHKANQANDALLPLFNKRLNAKANLFRHRNGPLREKYEKEFRAAAGQYTDTLDDYFFSNTASNNCFWKIFSLVWY